MASVRFASFSTGKGYQPQSLTNNLLQSSILVESPTQLLQDTSGDCSELRTKKQGQYITGPDIIDQAIRRVLDEQPFSSVHKIAKRTYIPMTKFNGD
jgi:hypothetical protein